MLKKKLSHTHSLRITLLNNPVFQHWIFTSYLPSIITLICQLHYSDINIPSAQMNLQNVCGVSFSTNCCLINSSDHIILLGNLFSQRASNVHVTPKQLMHPVDPHTRFYIPTSLPMASPKIGCQVYLVTPFKCSIMCLGTVEESGIVVSDCSISEV